MMLPLVALQYCYTVLPFYIVDQLQLDVSSAGLSASTRILPAFPPY